MRIRCHFIANLHITETQSILFLTKYDKNSIIEWAKAHSKTGYSVNNWKSSKTLWRLKRMCFDFRLRWTFFRVRKLVSRSARSQSWLCPFKVTKDEMLLLKCAISQQTELTWDWVAFPWIILTGERDAVIPATQFLSYLAVEKLLEKKNKVKPTWRSILEIRIRTNTQTDQVIVASVIQLGRAKAAQLKRTSIKGSQLEYSWMVGSLDLSWDTAIYQPVWRFIQSEGGK